MATNLQIHLDPKKESKQDPQKPMVFINFSNYVSFL